MREARRRRRSTEERKLSGSKGSPVDLQTRLWPFAIAAPLLPLDLVRLLCIWKKDFFTKRVTKHVVWIFSRKKWNRKHAYILKPR